MPKRLLIRVRVAEVLDIADRIRSYRFVPVHRSDMPPFKAGDHVFLRLADGLLRSYSLCGDPRDLSSYKIAVLREDDGRGGSRAIHETIGVGDLVHVSYPQPSLRLEPDVRKHLLIAGGIGVTPFVGVAIAMTSADHNIELHYAAKSSQAAAFVPELRRGLGNSLTTYFSQDGERLDINALLTTAGPETHIYVCGPDRLVSAVLAVASELGRPAESVHLESFKGLTADEAAAGDPFDVSLATSQRDLHVPANKSLLQVLREENIPIEYSCEGGVCGTCWVQYSDGDPIHRDSCLSPAQRASTIMSCVSRARTHLTLTI